MNRSNLIATMKEKVDSKGFAVKAFTVRTGSNKVAVLDEAAEMLGIERQELVRIALDDFIAELPELLAEALGTEEVEIIRKQLEDSITKRAERNG